METGLVRKPLYQDWLNLSFHLLWCYERVLTNPQEKESSFKNSGAWLVREGWAEVSHDGQTWRAEAGQWLIVRPSSREQCFSPGARILSVSFDAKWPDGRCLIDEGLSVVLDAAKFPTLEKHALALVRSMKKLSPESWNARNHEVDFYGYMQLQSRMSLWLSALVKAVRSVGVRVNVRQDLDERIVRAVRLLENGSFAESLDVTSLAEQVGMSTIHFSRRFKEQLHVTPLAYYDRLRTEQAVRQLHVPGVRVKEVALELGFVHLSHFSAWFKRHTGKSPREFMYTVQ